LDLEAKRSESKLQQQMDSITQLLRIKQQFVMQVIDSVLARHDHNPNNDKARCGVGLVRYER